MCQFRILVVVFLLAIKSSWLPMASWVYVKDGKDDKDGSCFPTRDTDRRSFTCKGDNITALPTDIPRNITHLNLSNTRIKALPSGGFTRFRYLRELYIRNSTELSIIEKNAFSGLHQLRILMIIDCMKLTTIGAGVLGTFQNLHTLRILKSGLSSVPDFSAFQTRSPSHNQNMYEIDLTTNRITHIRQGAFSAVRTWLLRLENNMLQEIDNFAFDGSQIFKLDFQNNPDLHSLGDLAFSGITHLQSLNLSRTSIWRLPTEGLINVQELNVEDVPTLKQFPSVLKFSNIEVARLTYPHHCCAFQHPEKQDPDEYLDYEHQRKLQMRQQAQQLSAHCTTPSIPPTPLSAPYTSPTSTSPSHLPVFFHKPLKMTMHHDTRFTLRSSPGTLGDAVLDHHRHSHAQGDEKSARDDGNTLTQSQSFVKFEDIMREMPFDPTMAPPHHPDSVGGFGHFDAHFNQFPHPTTSAPQHRVGGHGHFGHFDPIHISSGSTTAKSKAKNEGFTWIDKPTNETTVIQTCANFTKRKNFASVLCTPVPNAFNPCEDVMGYEWLRVTMWFVLLATLCGNMVVIVVLVTGRSKMTVPKFLMCNLSVADLLMGLYLLLLASIDVHSLGEYFTLAVSWQNDGGCQVAGFLTVFSSELSVFVLVVITLERWYAISYAIHITKRLRIRQAWGLMLTGWLYAGTMALLPLVGISGYGAVSICLPMEARDVWGKLYIVALLLLNGLAFLVVCCCYVSMFMKVRSSDTMARSNDATVAKRMSILVLTNFVCWAPIAFFGLTASFGFPMINISNSKILLVFFYPLNSCANPFLYVIMTKQFRKDVFILLGRYGLCMKRANEYKGTYTYKSHSNSRHNGMMATMHNTHRMSDMSMLSRLSTKSSRGSPNGTTPRMTPQTTPQTTPPCSPKSSPLRRLIGVATSALLPHANGGGWGAGWGIDNSGGGKGGGGKERKLSVVPETSQNSDDGSGPHEERVLEARDSLRDIFDGKPHGRVRSASEYVVLYHGKEKGEQVRDVPYREGRRRSSRFLLDRQPSLDTSISSATETSYVSDSSWARLDSFGSGQSHSTDGDWPGVARAVAVAAAKRTSNDSGNTPPLSPTIARMRMRFLPTRPRIPSDGESPTRPLPHTQLTRLLYNRSASQDSSGTDDDLLDDEAKVKQSLL